jgi:1-acyl-sn-glycerol-3-phosphate acyltransferase
MRYAIQWIRSVLFIAQMYIALAVIGFGSIPFAIYSMDSAMATMHRYCRWVRWTAGWMIGLKTEVRGEVPEGAVLIAAKHQSFLDILMIFGALPRGRFVMKKELVKVPVIGWYGLRVGCIPVDRGRRGRAIKDLVAQATSTKDPAGQLIIFSQGTRVAPGVKMPYKIGTGILYDQLKMPCVPVAVNVGVFWPRRSFHRKPGLAVIEFLPTIPAGLRMRTFMERLETEVETASDRLMAEAGFTGVVEE